MYHSFPVTIHCHVIPHSFHVIFSLWLDPKFLVNFNWSWHLDIFIMGKICCPDVLYSLCPYYSWSPQDYQCYLHTFQVSLSHSRLCSQHCQGLWTCCCLLSSWSSLISQSSSSLVWSCKTCQLFYAFQWGVAASNLAIFLSKPTQYNHFYPSYLRGYRIPEI